jgi:hypothetical protein
LGQPVSVSSPEYVDHLPRQRPILWLRKCNNTEFQKLSFCNTLELEEVFSDFADPALVGTSSKRGCMFFPTDQFNFTAVSTMRF